MESWVHGSAVSFDPGTSDRSRSIGNQIDINNLGASIRVGDAGRGVSYPNVSRVVYNFPWPIAGRADDTRPTTIDEIIVRARSAGEVGLGHVEVRAAEREVMDVRLDDPAIAPRDFATLRFQARRPLGWFDYDTPITGPLAVELGVELAGGNGGSIEVAAVGVTLRLAYTP